MTMVMKCCHGNSYEGLTRQRLGGVDKATIMKETYWMTAQGVTRRASTVGR